MIYVSLPKLINLYFSFIFQIGRGLCWPPKFPLCTGGGVARVRYWDGCTDGYTGSRARHDGVFGDMDKLADDAGEMIDRLDQTGWPSLKLHNPFHSVDVI